jgi:hypothetical protein
MSSLLTSSNSQSCCYANAPQTRPQSRPLRPQPAQRVPPQAASFAVTTVPARSLAPYTGTIVTWWSVADILLIPFFVGRLIAASPTHQPPTALPQRFLIPRALAARCSYS